MNWQKIEDSNYNEWALVDSNNNQLVMIGYYDTSYKKVYKVYKVYQNKPLSFLFDFYEERVDIRSMKKFVEKTVKEWMKTNANV
jgi:hypothetical protein